MPSNSHQAGDDSPVWWRSRWLDAMAEAGVKPMPRLVAYVYAEHARQGRDAWAPISRLIERTGMSESTAKRARRSLVSDGWLVEIEKADWHHSARYALVIPEAFRGADPAPLNEPGVQIPQSSGVRATPLENPEGQSDPSGVSERPVRGVRATPNQSPINLNINLSPRTSAPYRKRSGAGTMTRD